MAKNKTTIRFWLRTDRMNKDGTAPIHLVYQIQGQRKYYGIPETKVLPVNWDAESQKAIFLDKKAQAEKGIKGNSHLLLTAAEVYEINSRLDSTVTDVKSIENSFKDRRQEFTVDMVVNELKDKKGLNVRKSAHSNAVFDFIDKYIEDHKATRQPGTLTVFKSVKKHLANFQKATGNKVTFDKVDYSFFQSYQNYLITGPGLNNTTVAKQLSTIKTFLNYAKLQGFEISDKYRDFKIRREPLEVIALTNQEFENLFHLDLSGNKKLAQVRDVFCFACVTGLRYSDLQQLNWEHIKGTEIQLTVKKTREWLTIPLSAYADLILDKYRANNRPLPVISNQKMNDYLKTLCRLAEITEPIEIVRFKGSKREATVYPKCDLISVHTARKTFATLSLEKGMNAEEVMSITGHKDYKSFKRYVKVTEQRKKVVMKKAWGEILSPKLKAV